MNFLTGTGCTCGRPRLTGTEVAVYTRNRCAGVLRASAAPALYRLSVSPASSSPGVGPERRPLVRHPLPLDGPDVLVPQAEPAGDQLPGRLDGVALVLGGDQGQEGGPPGLLPLRGGRVLGR